jgi:hypothetical protein
MSQSQSLGERVMPLLRRNFLQAALGLGIAPLIAGRAAARADREGADAMAKDVVIIHGANGRRLVLRSI